ncbi:Hypothetical protein UVM_LOCUS415, partial [uncultured virus]
VLCFYLRKSDRGKIKRLLLAVTKKDASGMSTTGEPSSPPQTRRTHVPVGRAVAIGVAIVILAALAYVLVALLRDLGSIHRRSSVHRDRHPDWYGAEFPERAFPPLPELADDYGRRVRLGRRRMARTRLVVVSLLRDRAAAVPMYVERLQRVAPLFHEFRALVFENDSVDDTRRLLEVACRDDPRFALVQCPEDAGGRLRLPSAVSHGLLSRERMGKMAGFRNRCLDEVRRVCPDFEFLLVMDADLAGPMSLDGLASCFSYDDWDAMASNGLASRLLSHGRAMHPYDSIALVALGQQPTPLQVCNVQHVRHLFTRTPRRGEPPIRVRSAFGGACLYRLPELLASGARYGGEHCEHVSLHLDMGRRGLDRFFVNPSFLLLHCSELPSRSKNKVRPPKDSL